MPLFMIHVNRTYKVVVDAGDEKAAKTAALEHVKGTTSKSTHVFDTLDTVDRVWRLKPGDGNEAE